METSLSEYLIKSLHWCTINLFSNCQAYNFSFRFSTAAPSPYVTFLHLFADVWYSSDRLHYFFCSITRRWVITAPVFIQRKWKIGSRCCGCDASPDYETRPRTLTVRETFIEKSQELPYFSLFWPRLTLKCMFKKIPDYPPKGSVCDFTIQQ